MERPLIIKPRRGHCGARLHLIEETTQSTSMQASPGPLTAQRYMPGPEEGPRVYVAGENVRVVRKPLDPRSFTRFGRSVHVDEEIKDITA